MITRADRIGGILVMLLTLAVATCSRAAIPVYGNSGGWYGVPIHLGSGGICAADGTSFRGGEWGLRPDQPGTYTAAFEDARGFGPVLRAGIAVDKDSFNRVDLSLPVECDLIQQGELSEQKRREYGQTFKATGTSITAILFKNADQVRVSMHEVNGMGKQVGETVSPATFYPDGTLPTVPGKTYYLKFVRDDGKPFAMYIVPNSPYRDGRAWLDGRSQDNADLALRVQFQPAGQILRHKPGLSEAYEPAKNSYGQTFVAKGTSLALFDAFTAQGDKPSMDKTIRFFEGGPGGRQIGPTIKSHAAVFNPGDLPLLPGETYYIEISGKPGLRLWTERSDIFPTGDLYVDGNAVRDRDLAMILVEYTTDNVPPPPPTLQQPHRLVADGRVEMIWDLPPSNDITKVRIRRVERSRRGTEGDGELIAETPVCAQGRYTYGDSGLTNGSSYIYTIRTVDAAGNESEPTRFGVTPVAGIPMRSDIINPDFDDARDFAIPYGWTPRLIGGDFPELSIGPSDWGDNVPMSFGWYVPEGMPKADMAIYQQVACEKGRTYEFSCETKIWNPWNSIEMLIWSVAGIDPTGGTDPTADTVIWGTPNFTLSKWLPISAKATAQSDRITVFLRGYSEYSRCMETRFRTVRLSDATPHG